MRVLIEYADNPEWNHVVEGESWSEIMQHVGCTASRLTDLDDYENRESV